MPRTTLTYRAEQVDGLREIYGRELSVAELYRKAAEEVLARTTPDEDAIRDAVRKGALDALEEYHDEEGEEEG